jgi:aconitate hydratase
MHHVHRELRALIDEVAAAVDGHDLNVVAVLSGNRNFEGRIHPLVRSSYLASPPLVVAYALAGTVTKDLTVEPLGTDPAGAPVYLRDIWPSQEEIQQTVSRVVKPEMFRRSYGNVWDGNETWNKIPVSGEALYECGNKAEAKESFERALKEKPGDAAAKKWLDKAGK